MTVDKNLFLYDLAVVAIMKNEAPYVKEWLDYHLLAGVDHFYIYDHESPDNFKEVLQPYIDAGIVTYIFYPDQFSITDAYNDALNQYKIFCRYMAFIDADEFIFPKNNRSIVEIVDGFFGAYDDAAEINIKWLMFGSNGHEKADYGRGVLERFTRRAAEAQGTIKSVVNPRRVKFFYTPHFSVTLEGNLAYGLEVDLVAINHYYTKSFEEFVKRRTTSPTYKNYQAVSRNVFEQYDFNDVFDDGILKYREARQNALQTGGGGSLIEKLSPSKQIDFLRLFNALLQNLYPILLKDSPQDFFRHNMETFLVCRELAVFLQNNSITEDAGKFFEELALNAIYKTMITDMTIIDATMLLNELPKLTTRNYPVVKEIYNASIVIATNLKNFYADQSSELGKFQLGIQARTFERLANMLETFNPFKHD